MQPKTLAIVVTFLPLFVMNLVYMMSATAELVPSCIPYLDGCTSISRAARRGNAIFVFRACMIVQAVLLAWYWVIARQWLNQLAGKTLKPASIMSALGIIASLFLILYADFLGTDGRIYRYMRQYGIIFFFTLTPFAQMIMINELFKLSKVKTFSPFFLGVIRYQIGVVVCILGLGLISLGLSYSGNSSFERENILEWNYAVLMSIFHLGSCLLWGDVKIHISVRQGKEL
ncbi:hypothetical protein SG34_018455 [Thalassomonas viridans]|uniref:Uncharacterized protein n=1 Tax=Thalassomonas viridans TaxID=137584 RepID=A0AAF0C5I1_9GAMM|nr:hypothetical protein [Thalassomonas viridans]WDE03372.1 hypothetical protein SG34_018455 [Thalassomonas viridans]